MFSKISTERQAAISKAIQALADVLHPIAGQEAQSDVLFLINAAQIKLLEIEAIAVKALEREEKHAMATIPTMCSHGFTAQEIYRAGLVSDKSITLEGAKKAIAKLRGE